MVSVHTSISRSTLALAAVLVAGPLAAQTPAQVMGAPYMNSSRAFIDVMVPQLEMAAMMAAHHGSMSKNEAVKALASRMAAADKAELTQLRAARLALFGSDSSRGPMMGGMMKKMAMSHMGETGDMAKMHAMADSTHARHQAVAKEHEGMAGMGGMMAGDHDRMFLEHMIMHHQDGIDVAILAEQGAAAPLVKQIAHNSRMAQERELAEMRRLLASLPPAPAAAPGQER